MFSPVTLLKVECIISTLKLHPIPFPLALQKHPRYEELYCVGFFMKVFMKELNQFSQLNQFTAYSYCVGVFMKEYDYNSYYLERFPFHFYLRFL